MKRSLKVVLIIACIVSVFLLPVILREAGHWQHYRTLEKEGELRSEIVVLKAPKALAPQEKGQCEIEITNLGTTTWTADKNFRLGGFERSLLQDRIEPPQLGPPRIEVKGEVQQGEIWEVSFDIEALDKEGLYRLHLQMLQENVTWFGDEAVIDVRVIKRISDFDP